MYGCKWRHQYDEKTDKQLGAATAVSFVGEESLTKQSFTKDADINEIVRRCGVTGEELPPPPTDPRFYGDTADLPDLRAVLERGREATERFMALPAKLREKFDNRPAKLWKFVNDPDNVDECVRLGLLARHTPAVVEVPPVPVPPAAS